MDSALTDRGRNSIGREKVISPIPMPSTCPSSFSTVTAARCDSLLVDTRDTAVGSSSSDEPANDVEYLLTDSGRRCIDLDDVTPGSGSSKSPSSFASLIQSCIEPLYISTSAFGYTLARKLIFQLRPAYAHIIEHRR